MTSDERVPPWASGNDTTAQNPVPRQDEPTMITERVYGTVPAAGLAPAAPEGGADATVSQAKPASTAADAADRGRTTIADEVVERVIEKVVNLAVAEIPGVHALHPDVDTFFGGADAGTPGRAVSVRLESDAAEINVAIEVEFGHSVPEAVERLRTAVIGSAERLLGLTVAEVNVAVAGVAFPEPDPATE